jgi:hypothetical protein
MKYKTTNKQLKEGYKNIITIGYCEAQNLLQYSEPIAYTCGIYGWNADVYQIDYKTAIVTGYRPTEGLRNYKIVREYDQKAERLLQEARQKSIDFMRVKSRLDDLIIEMAQKIIEMEA